MARKSRAYYKKSKPNHRIRRDPVEPSAPRIFERRPPTQYGQPIIILEDADKNTFEFSKGAWVPFGMTIAECREECQVRTLPQQVNGKTRYEIRMPIVVE